MLSTEAIAKGTKTDVFFVKHISSINPQRRIPLEGVEWIETTNSKGSRVQSDPKPFEQGYMPESLQGIRFPFSVSNGYVYDRNVFGPSEEQKRALIKDCAFTYIKGKDMGKVIDDANPRNADDAFFSHPDLTLKLEEFAGGYDLSNSKNKILYSFIKLDPRFLVIEDSNEMPDIEEIHPNVEFLVTHSGITEAIDQKKGHNVMELYAKLEKASLAELKVIASIWGDIITNEDTSEKILKQQFAFRFDQKKKIPGGTRTFSESFMELIALKGEKLNTKYLIKQAKQLGIIRLTNIGFTFNNNPLGSSEDLVESFLLDPQNSALRGAIQMELDGEKPSIKNTKAKKLADENDL